MCKHFIIIGVFVVFFNFVVFAQVNIRPGVVAGLSLFTETAKTNGTSVSTDTRTGFVAGVVMDIDIFKMVSIEPGLVFSERGGRMPFVDLSYLAIPVHAKLKWPGMPVISPYALAGINLAFLLTSASTNSVGSPFTDAVSSMAFGLDLGAGIEFSLPGVIPFVEYVYDFGLSNIVKNTVGDESQKTSGSEIKAGLRFKF
jgi:opacity protein-like surface antigen